MDVDGERVFLGPLEGPQKYVTGKGCEDPGQSLG